MQDQAFSSTIITGILCTSRSEIAGTLSLGKDAFSRPT